MECKKATIYTGTGDNGTTSLAGGTRVAKDHLRVEAYGVIDELNAHIGLLAAALNNEDTKYQLQKALFSEDLLAHAAHDGLLRRVRAFRRAMGILLCGERACGR